MEAPDHGQKVVPSSRLILTHDSFMKMMEYLAPRYRFFRHMYEGQKIGLSDFDQTEITDGIDTFILNPVPHSEP